MYARVSTFEGPPEGFDVATKRTREEILPAARQIDGFAGLIALGDRATGKTIGITLWDSLDAMNASEEAASRLRDSSAAANDERIVSVERYEVLLDEKGQ